MGWAGGVLKEALVFPLSISRSKSYGQKECKIPVLDKRHCLAGSGIGVRCITLLIPSVNNTDVSSISSSVG